MIRSIRKECLDKLLIDHQAGVFTSVAREYTEFFNTVHPHQGLDQQIHVPMITHKTTSLVSCRAVLDGILHDYYRDAA